MEKKFYNKIVKSNREVIYLIFYHNYRYLKINYLFDNISKTYLGFFIDSEISTFRGFINTHPNFLNDFDDISLENWLTENGYELKETSSHHLFIFGDR